MNAEQAKNDIERLEALLRMAGCDLRLAVPVTDSASSRRYYRLHLAEGEPDLIGTVGTIPAENEAFIYLSRHLRSRGLPVPEVMAVSADRMAYLQSDAGARSLYARLQEEGESEGVAALLDDIASTLPRIQFEGAQGLDSSRCYPIGRSTRRSRMWDLNYFKYDFLKAVGVEPDDLMLEDEFDRLLAGFELPGAPVALQLRDFQCRNIMIDDSGRWSVIDFQGSRLGNPLYDLASFAWQTRAGFDDSTRRRLADRYYRALTEWHPMERADFDRLLRLTVLFRQLQVLGAYGLRGLVQRKPGFTAPIARTLANILGEEGAAADFPYLTAMLRRAAAIVGADDARRTAAGSDVPGVLTVDITSFAFKRGYPADLSGNGGGFIFDCRWMANPGRYDRYKALTGRDDAVVEFLNEAGQCDRFTDEALAMIRPAIDRYLERGFTHLAVGFGCTGGQHRSLRCADLLAARLAALYAGRPVALRLTHREQNISELITLSAKQS